MFKLTERKAKSFLMAGDELEGIVKGQFSEPIDGAAVAAFAVGGLLGAGLVSHSGEAGWLLFTRQAILVVVASKVTGGPGNVQWSLPRDAPLTLGGRNGRKLDLGKLTLKVDKADMEVLHRLGNVAGPSVYG